MNHQTKKKLDYFKKYIQKMYSRWVKEYPNIIGAYPGEKFKEDSPTGRYSIVFLVSKKQARPQKEIPKSFILNIPGLGKKKILTDVIKSNKLKLRTANLSDKIKRTSLNTFGSNGLFLINGQRIFACTNAHVLLPDMIQSGKTRFFKPINQQFQPDVSILNSHGQRFKAYLQKGIFDGIDAAIARMDDSSDAGNQIPGFGQPNGIRNIQSNDNGLSLLMVGNVTGKSQGIVTRVGVTKSTSIPEVFLHDLVETTIFSQHGDSGSPVFTSGLKMVGIVVGGTTPDITYIIPITKILDYFKCELLN